MVAAIVMVLEPRDDYGDLETVKGTEIGTVAPSKSESKSKSNSNSNSNNSNSNSHSQSKSKSNGDDEGILG